MTVESQDLPSTVEIPAEATNHPLAITGYIVLVLLIIAAVAKRYATATIAPMWQWVTGRDSRAYAELVEELELVQQQLEASRLERLRADERHSQEIADLRDQHSRETAAMREQQEKDMRILGEALAETRRELAKVLAGVTAARTAFGSADSTTN